MKKKPYFETELGELYCGDCIEIMKDIPDGSVDLVLTDPPYGMNYKSNYYKNGNPFGGIKGDSEYPVAIIKDCIENANCGVFSFCRWENLKELPKSKSFIVWIKNNWTAGDLEHEYARQWEGIAFWEGKNHKFINGRPQDVIDMRRIPSTQLNHPTEKPVSLIYEILRHNEGDIILDPFLGSGTTAVACEKLGRRWIGIEISEKYCEIAKARIKAEADQVKLF